MACWDHGAGHPGTRPGRRRAGVPRAGRAVPPGTAGALLPADRFAGRCRGPAAGDATGRLAGPGRLPAAVVAALVAVPHRDQPVPQRAARGRAARPGQPRAAAAGRRAPARPVPPFQPPEPTRRSEITWLQPYPDALLEGIADTAPGPEA